MARSVAAAPHEIRTFLTSEADGIALRHERQSIPVGRLSYDLGACIQREDIAKYKSYLVLPERNTDWARIILPLPTVQTTRRRYFERFCVAHELAHLLIHREFNVLPNKKSVYWQHEIYCNEFARRMLMPERMMAVESRTDPLTRLHKLSAFAEVPIMEAARRLHELDPDIAFFKVSTQNGVRVYSSSFGGGLARGRTLSGLLARRISEISRRRLDYMSMILNRDQVNSSGLAGLGLPDLTLFHMSVRPTHDPYVLVAAEPLSEEMPIENQSLAANLPFQCFTPAASP